MNKISLKYRIAFIIFLLEAVMISLVLWQTESKFSSEIQANINEKEEIWANILSDLSRFAIINSEYAELQLYIQKMASDPFVSKIVVADYRDNIVSSTHSNLIGQKIFLTENSKQSHWIKKEISNPAGLLGSLSIEFSTTPLRRALKQGRSYGIAVALTSMLIIASFGIVIGFLLTRRIDKLALATRDFANGNTDVSIEISGDDEIASLGQDFQEMSLKINNQINNLKESEARYHSLFKNNHCVMLIINPDTGDIVDANPAACQFYGYSYNNLTNKTILEINQLSKEEIQQEMSNAKLDRRNHFYFKHKLKNGTIKDVEVYSGPINIFDQKLLYSIIHDISDKKMLERSLRRSKEEWEKTFDAMSDIVTIQDKDMHIVRANKAACDFFKVEYGDLIGEYCYEVFRGITKPCRGCPLVETLQNISNHSEIMQHENLGKFFQVSSSAITTDKGGIKYLVHVARDITKQKRLEEELFQSHKMEAIGTLAGGIAHDFNNILAAIIGYSEFIQEAVPADSPIGRDIDKVLISGKRAAELVGQILTFSRKTDSAKQNVYPHLLVNEALKMLRATLPTSITIETDIDPDCGMTLADPTSIHQIIVNLCTNALHAMPDNKGVLSVSLQSKKCNVAEMIWKTTLPPGDFIVLTVHDSGHGMDKTTMNRIFEPYFSTKELGDGTGLGLALVHGIVQECNGFIAVESTVGEGSTFKIFFPAVKEPISQPVVSVPKDKATRVAGNERILMVDDELLLVKINEKRLQALGYRVTGVTDSSEALSIFRSQPDNFDLLITDQTMPGLTGEELAEAMLAIKPSLPVIVCTGHSETFSKEEALSMGIKKYVFKPLHGDELLDAVQEVLAEK